MNRYERGYMGDLLNVKRVRRKKILTETGNRLMVGFLIFTSGYFFIHFCLWAIRGFSVYGLE